MVTTCLQHSLIQIQKLEPIFLFKQSFSKKISKIIKTAKVQAHDITLKL